MAIVLNWVNYSDPTVNNAVTTFDVGATNAVQSNGVFTVGNLLIASALIAWPEVSQANAISDLSGWTPLYNAFSLNSGQAFAVWSKIVGASETGSYATSWTTTSYAASWSLAAFAGASGSPVDVNGGIVNDTYSTSVTAPSITPTLSNDLLVCIWGTPGGNPPYTVPAGFSLISDISSNSSDKPEILVGSLQLSSTAATGTQLAGQSSSAQSFGFSGAFKTASSTVNTTHGMQQFITAR